jgi:hypothetical protein
MTSRPSSWLYCAAAIALRIGSIRERRRDKGGVNTLSLSFVDHDTSGFFLEGRLDGSPVSAVWDGQELTVTDSLLVLVRLADAVDAVYAEAGLDSGSPSSFDIRSPGSTLVALVKLCDEVTCVEYLGRTGLQKLV